MKRLPNGNKPKCKGKARFSKKEAKSQANYYKDRTGDHMRAYKCGICNNYHIGHSNERKPSYTPRTKRRSAKEMRERKRIAEQLKKLS